ncbi:MAG: 1,4-dihydroxy-2-naphthoate polyprenyltransferase [Actinomycetales bacterium]|nr:1,4-dihydroxy-2-naphthoate polyprenyltransferase [Actinomycetales bacterium]
MPARKAGSGRSRGTKPAGPPPPATLGTWIAGARPLTLLLAIAPVALGTGAASLDPSMPYWYHHWVRALLCLAVAVFLQIAVNYANDYSDGVRGTDRDRVGPQRLVGSGRAKPRQVLAAAIVFFALAAVAGGVLVWRSGQWWLLAVGAVCILAAWFYTGGKRPYGYLPLGELAVLLFFGVVPTAGTMFVQVGTVNWEAWVSGIAAGAFAAAVLMANNLRDRERDAQVGKRTLAVLAGGLGSRITYVVLVLVPFAALAFWVQFYPLAGYVFFVGLAVAPAILITLTARTARELVTVLQLTLLSSVSYGLGLAAAFAYWD